MKKIGATWLCWAALTIFLVSPARATLSFSTIVTNGPATNRANLVFFSEGYTNGQQSAFLNDVTNAANAFFAVAPYAEYASYFNVFAIFTNSAHVGSTYLGNNQTYVAGYTAFNSTYDAGSGNLVTIPPNVSDSNYSHGQGKIDSLLQQYLPATNNDFAFLVVNDAIHAGGSDNYGKVAVFSVANYANLLAHESGHAIGALGDEYTNPYPGYPTNDVEPNTTVQTNYAQIKWNAWISADTPLPTPFTIPYAATVGLFEGAHYHTTGWYRPYENCRMQSMDYPGDFCPVCQEALVLGICAKARLVDSRLPATNTLSVTNAQMLSFSVNLLHPATHSLNVQWLTNGVAVPDATNALFYAWPAQFGNGTGKVEADVWDATDLVRNDAKNILRQTNLWTLNVAIPVMQLDSLTWLTNGSFSLRVTGSAPAGVVIQMSTNLLQWAPVQTSSFSSGKFFYTNAGAKTAPQRFFRAVAP